MTARSLLILVNRAALGYKTSHNRANYAVRRISNDLKDSDGIARVKNHPEYKVACD